MRIILLLFSKRNCARKRCFICSYSCEDGVHWMWLWQINARVVEDTVMSYIFNTRLLNHLTTRLSKLLYCYLHWTWWFLLAINSLNVCLTNSVVRWTFIVTSKFPLFALWFLLSRVKHYGSAMVTPHYESRIEQTPVICVRLTWKIHNLQNQLYIDYLLVSLKTPLMNF